MQTKEYKSRLDKMESLLRESVFLLGNGEFPVYNFLNEPFPDEIPFVFQPSQISIFPETQTILNPEGDIIVNANYMNRNFSCKLCSDRDRGIRGFLIRGRKKLLILHYTGFTGKTNSFPKKSNKTIFRNNEIQECFKELTEKYAGSHYEEFFFQEYPACHFSKELDDKNWERRTTNCDFHILETVEKEHIKAILVLGSSAVLRWNAEFCKKYQGKVMSWKFSNGKELPFLITRSPEALYHAKSQSSEKYQSIMEEMGANLTKLSQTIGGFD